MWLGRMGDVQRTHYLDKEVSQRDGVSTTITKSKVARAYKFYNC